MPPHWVGFLCRFGLKEVAIFFVHFGLESGMVFEGTTGPTGVYNEVIVSIPNE